MNYLSTGELFAEAKNLNEAILVASRFPGARRGGIEVRPVMEFEQP